MRDRDSIEATDALGEVPSAESQSDGGRIGWEIILICAVGALIAAYECWILIDNPLLGSDSGLRVFKADQPVLKLGNRIWLPLLQVHIWIYHLLGLPFAGLKLISSFYISLATLCLGLYWHRVSGVGVSSFLMAVLAMVCLAGHMLTKSSSALMQEPIGFGLFITFILLAANGRAGSLFALAVGAAAMLTRDSYWFYLAAATFVGLRQLPWDGRRVRSFAALWGVPIGWMCVCVPILYLVAYGRLPTIPLEWPLMYNPVGKYPNAISSAESLRIALVRSQVLPLAGGLLLAVGALASWKGKQFVKLFDWSPFSREVIRSWPVAVLVTYGLIWVINPWQVTPGNARAGWPLLELSLVVAPLLIRAAASAPRGLRLFVMLCVAGGLVAGVDLNARRVREDVHRVTRSEHARLAGIVRSLPYGRDTNVCLMASDSWITYRELTAPLFLVRKSLVASGSEIGPDCNLLIVEEGSGKSAPDSYERIDTISVGASRWNIYRE